MWLYFNSITYLNDVVVIALICFNCSSSLWARLTLPHTKRHLKMAVGDSWSSAGLSPGKSNNISNGSGRIGIGNQTRGVAPLGPAHGWPGTGLRAQPATATLANTPQVSAAAELRIWCFHLPRMKGGLGHALLRGSNRHWFLLFGLWKGNNAMARYMIWMGLQCPIIFLRRPAQTML